MKLQNNWIAGLLIGFLGLGSLAQTTLAYANQQSTDCVAGAAAGAGVGAGLFGKGNGKWLSGLAGGLIGYASGCSIGKNLDQKLAQKEIENRQQAQRECLENYDRCSGNNGISWAGDNDDVRGRYYSARQVYYKKDLKRSCREYKHEYWVHDVHEVQTERACKSEETDTWVEVNATDVSYDAPSYMPLSNDGRTIPAPGYVPYDPAPMAPRQWRSSMRCSAYNGRGTRFDVPQSGDPAQDQENAMRGCYEQSQKCTYDGCRLVYRLVE